MVDELWTRAANELAAMIAGGETSSREVVDAHLARIDEPVPTRSAVPPGVVYPATVLGGTAGSCP